MMGLAPHIGRQQAHDIVYDACRTVNEKGGTLAEALAALPEVTRHFDRAAIDRLTDPANYLGLAPQMVDRALALSAERRSQPCSTSPIPPPPSLPKETTS